MPSMGAWVNAHHRSRIRAAGIERGARTPYSPECRPTVFESTATTSRGQQGIVVESKVSTNRRPNGLIWSTSWRETQGLARDGSLRNWAWKAFEQKGIGTMTSRRGKRSGRTNSGRPDRFTGDYGKSYAPKGYPRWVYDEIVAVKSADDRALAAEARDEEDDAAPVSAPAESSSPVVGPRVPRKLLPMGDALEQLRAPDQRPPAP